MASFMSTANAPLTPWQGHNRVHTIQNHKQERFNLTTQRNDGKGAKDDFNFRKVLNDINKYACIGSCSETGGGGQLPTKSRETSPAVRLSGLKFPRSLKEKTTQRNAPDPRRWRAAHRGWSPPPCAPVWFSCRPGHRPGPGWPWSRWPLRCRILSGFFFFFKERNRIWRKAEGFKEVSDKRMIKI